MPRLLVACALLAALTLAGRAAPPAAPSETVIRLTVAPAPAPRPALRYLLLPELKEMNPGNPIHNYMKCFMEQQKFFFDKEAFERRAKLLAMPLRALPAQELQDYGGEALRQADWAARLDKPDWQILLRLKTDGFGLLLPDVQNLRNLANALKVRFRAEVALGRFDDAVRTAKTMFAIARHLGEHPTYIGNLVGIAIATVAIGPLEEMLEQPGCPNLYWALTNLPDPLVPLDRGAEGERVSVQSELHDLDDRAAMSPDQVKRFIAHLDKLLSIGIGNAKRLSVPTWVDARARDAALVRAARGRLVAVGLPEDRVAQFPPEQVILLDEKREYEARRDDDMKLLHLPAWQIEVIAAKARPREPALFDDVLSAQLKVCRARGRLQQRMALLRHVEALRLYAAEHGAWPARLADVSVPLPEDPFTGKPFQYEVNGGTAHLRGTPPSAEDKSPGYRLHYELTLQK